MAVYKHELGTSAGVTLTSERERGRFELETRFKSSSVNYSAIPPSVILSQFEVITRALRDIPCSKCDLPRPSNLHWSSSHNNTQRYG